MKAIISILFFTIVSTLAFTQENNPEKLLKKAKQFEAEGNRGRAVKMTDSLYQKFPNDIYIAIYKAQLLSGDEKFSEAQTLIEKALEKNSKDFDLLSVYVDILRWSGQYDKSIAYADTILKHYPDNQSAIDKKKKATELKTPTKQADVEYELRLLKINLLVKDKRYDEALKDLAVLMKDYPQDLTLEMYEAKIYAYKQDYKTSIEKHKTLVQKNPDDFDLINQYVDVLRWDNQYEAALAWCEFLLDNEPKNIEVLFKKARIQEALENNKDAMATYRTILAIEPDNQEAADALNRLEELDYKSHIGVFYFLTFFEDQAPWHFSGVEFQHNFKNFPVRAVLTRAHRFGQRATQFEIEAYPKINERMYIHAGLGFSNSSVILPSSRWMGDLYRTFNNGFEGSVGFRSLVFGEVNNFFLSFYGAKYYKNWWFFYRNFIFPPPNDNRVYLTHTFQARYYYNDKDRFTALTFFTGNLPLFAAVLDDNFSSRTTGFNLEHQIKFEKFWLARFGLMVESEEFQVQRFRNRYTLVGILIKRF